MAFATSPIPNLPIYFRRLHAPFRKEGVLDDLDALTEKIKTWQQLQSAYPAQSIQEIYKLALKVAAKYETVMKTVTGQWLQDSAEASRSFRDLVDRAKANLRTLTSSPAAPTQTQGLGNSAAPAAKPAIPSQPPAAAPKSGFNWANAADSSDEESPVKISITELIGNRCHEMTFMEKLLFLGIKLQEGGTLADKLVAWYANIARMRDNGCTKEEIEQLLEQYKSLQSKLDTLAGKDAQSSVIQHFHQIYALLKTRIAPVPVIAKPSSPPPPSGRDAWGSDASNPKPQGSAPTSVPAAGEAQPVRDDWDAEGSPADASSSAAADAAKPKTPPLTPAAAPVAKPPSPPAVPPNGSTAQTTRAQEPPVKAADNAFTQASTLQYWYTADDFSQILQSPRLQVEFEPFTIPQALSANWLSNPDRALFDTITKDKPLLTLCNVKGNHWISLAVIRSDDGQLHLFCKDSLGPQFSAKPLSQLTPLFATTRVHQMEEQKDGSACGPLALQNLRIMAQAISDDKAKFMQEFEQLVFCPHSEVEFLRKTFGALYDIGVVIGSVTDAMRQEANQKEKQASSKLPIRYSSKPAPAAAAAQADATSTRGSLDTRGSVASNVVFQERPGRPNSADAGAKSPPPHPEGPRPQSAGAKPPPRELVVLWGSGPMASSFGLGDGPGSITSTGGAPAPHPDRSETSRDIRARLPSEASAASDMSVSALQALDAHVMTAKAPGGITWKTPVAKIHELLTKDDRTRVAEIFRMRLRGGGFPIVSNFNKLFAALSTSANLGEVLFIPSGKWSSHFERIRTAFWAGYQVIELNGDTAQLANALTETYGQSPPLTVPVYKLDVPTQGGIFTLTYRPLPPTMASKHQREVWIPSLTDYIGHHASRVYGDLSQDLAMAYVAQKAVEVEIFLRGERSNATAELPDDRTQDSYVYTSIGRLKDGKITWNSSFTPTNKTLEIVNAALKKVQPRSVTLEQALASNSAPEKTPGVQNWMHNQIAAAWYYPNLNPNPQVPTVVDLLDMQHERHKPKPEDTRSRDSVGRPF